MTMTREKMKEIQGIRSRPRREFKLNHKAVYNRAVESLAKHCLETKEDPMEAWHKHLAPLDTQEKKSARIEASEIVAEVRKEIETKKAAEENSLAPGECPTCGVGNHCPDCTPEKVA